MPIFRKSKAVETPSAPRPSMTFDNLMGNAQAHQFVAQCQAGDWRPAHEYCEALTDWDARYFLADALSELDQFPAGWVESTSGAQFPVLVRGCWGVKRAWEIRGATKAEGVDQSAWAPFFATLNEAETDLSTAADLLPSDPSPWTRMISTAMGLQVSKDEVLRRFHEANARQVGFQAAHHLVIGAVAEKWSGSHALMFDVARTANATLPDGSPGRIAICSAHYERRLYRDQWEHDKEGAKQYYKSPEVCAEIEDAARRSVFSVALRPSVLTPLLWNQFALALALTGDAVHPDRIAAAQLFAWLGDTGVPGPPWSQRFGSTAGEKYVRIRAICQKAAANG